MSNHFIKHFYLSPKISPFSHGNSSSNFAFWTPFILLFKSLPTENAYGKFFFFSRARVCVCTEMVSLWVLLISSLQQILGFRLKFRETQQTRFSLFTSFKYAFKILLNCYIHEKKLSFYEL